MENKHRQFILKPINSVIEEAVQACSILNDGIETYTLKDYMFQSLFLQMTGFQEQKLKCICWELATNNYDYRRKLLRNDDNLGEYSSYEAKSKIYVALVNCINENNCNDSTNFVLSNKDIMARSIKDEIVKLFNGTLFINWRQREYDSFLNDNKLFKKEHFGNAGLLEGCLVNVYKSLYNTRNRYAHNTLSYQENLPDFKALANEVPICNNYFVWFGLLILLDKIFMELYITYFNTI